MKPKHIILCVICLVAVALAIMLSTALRKHTAQMACITQLPDTVLVTISGETLFLTNHNSDQRTVLMFFSPDCEYCRKEIMGIISNAADIKMVDWIFLTISSQDDMDAFLKEYPLLTIPKATIVIDELAEFHRALGVTAPPSIFIYDGNGILEHYKRGAVSIKTILEWLN